MGKCVNHPDRETSYHCMKHNIYLCDECLECRDPSIYCKFRSSCPIYFMTEKGFDDAEPEAETVHEACTVVFQPNGETIDVSR